MAVDLKFMSSHKLDSAVSADFMMDKLKALMEKMSGVDKGRDHRKKPTL